MTADDAEIAGLKYACRAPAWLRKSFTVPAAWSKGKIFLHVGGVQPAATFWLNEERLGSTTSSRCPLRIDLGGRVRPGSENLLVVRLFWPAGPHMSGLWDWERGAEGNKWDAGWQGLYRRVWLEHVPSTYVRELHCSGTIEPLCCTLRFVLGGGAVGDAEALVDIRAVGKESQYQASVPLEHARPDKVYEVAVKMPGAKLWSPESPQLYTARLQLMVSGREVDSVEDRFGLRELRVEGPKVLLNGRPVFLRGGCDDQSYPYTVCPPASKEFYLARLRTARDYGFNYTKSCIEVFTPEFLQAADEVGILVCQEMPFGLFGETRKLRDDPPDAWIGMYSRELENIVRSDRNHPSVAFYSMSSELAVAAQSPRSFRTFNQDLPALTRRLNPAALIFDVTQTGEFGVETKLGRRNTDLIENVVKRTKGLRRDPLDGPLSLPAPTKLSLPLVLHEYWWWTSLPEPLLAPAYEKTAVRHGSVALMLDSARRNGIADEVPQMVKASRQLKYALQKEGLENARKHPQVAGYHFWLIHDFHWCPEGILDEFWQPPAGLSGSRFRQYNGDTVLLVDDGDRRSFRCGESPELGLMVSHFGPQRLEQPALSWRLSSAGRVIATGNRKMDAIACGAIASLGPIHPRMPDGPGPVRLVLYASLEDQGQSVCENSWDLWSFPEPAIGRWQGHVTTELAFLRNAYPDLKGRSKHTAASPAVLGTDKLDRDTLDWIERGGRVLLLSDSALKPYWRKGDREYSYTSNYRTIPYLCGTRGNMGTVIHPHPALGDFPHEGWCDLNFVHLVSGALAIDLSPFGPGRLKPIIRSADHYKTMADKAYLVEIGLGRGVLLACSLRIAETYASHPEARYLLDCMLRYLVSDTVRPQQSVTRAQLEAGCAGPIQ